MVGTGPGPWGYFFHWGQEEQAAKCKLLKGQLEQGTDSFVSVTAQAGRGRVDSGPVCAITETPSPSTKPWLWPGYPLCLEIQLPPGRNSQGFEKRAATSCKHGLEVFVFCFFKAVSVVVLTRAQFQLWFRGFHHCCINHQSRPSRWEYLFPDMSEGKNAFRWSIVGFCFVMEIQGKSEEPTIFKVTVSDSSRVAGVP